MKVRFFDPGKEYLKIRDEVLPEIDRVLTAGDLILRNDLEVFEENFAKLVGTKYAVGVASGTDALILSLKALGIGQGDEVLAPSYTFRATIEAICHTGATPILYDLDGKFTLTNNTKAIVPAYIAGDVDINESIFPIFKNNGMFVVEDFCQAITAAPARGDSACYSFYPAKILGCYGDGGAIATNDEWLAQKLKLARNHFKGDWKPIGYNSRLDNLQAAVLNVKLRHLTQNLARRREIALKYSKFLPTKLKVPKARKIYQDYIVECRSEEERDNLYDFLMKNGIETMKNGYPFPIAFPKLPQALRYELCSLRIPCNPVLTDKEVDFVIKNVKEFYKK